MRNLPPTLIIACAAASSAACGAPSSLELCHADCAAAGRCGKLTSESDCHAACDQRQSELARRDEEEDMHCANAPEVRRLSLSCLERPCEEIATCGGEIDRRCLPK